MINTRNREKKSGGFYEIGAIRLGQTFEQILKGWAGF